MPRLIHLLDVDPELGSGLAPEDFQAVRRALVARTEVVAPGPWQPPVAGEDAHALGLLVLGGLATRSIHHGARMTIELVGEEDVLRPWDDQAWAPVSVRIAWEVLQPLTIASLDRRLAVLLGRYPAVLISLQERMTRRTRALAFQNLVRALPALDQRLPLLLWQLAMRWGRVCPEGVWLPLKLSHKTLAGLVGARRPSVSAALVQLESRGTIRRGRDGLWLLDDEVLRPRAQRERPEVPSPTPEDLTSRP